jgi:hypothetical protein
MRGLSALPTLLVFRCSKSSSTSQLEGGLVSQTIRLFQVSAGVRSFFIGTITELTLFSLLKSALRRDVLYNRVASVYCIMRRVVLALLREGAVLFAVICAGGCCHCSGHRLALTNMYASDWTRTAAHVITCMLHPLH